MGPSIRFKTYAERYLPLPFGPICEPDDSEAQAQAPREEPTSNFVIFVEKRLHLALQASAQEKSVCSTNRQEDSFPQIFRYQAPIS